MQINVAVTDANNIVCEVTPPQPEIIVIDRGVAGNGIVSIVPVTISTFQYLRITYTNGTVQDVGPLTSTAYTATAPITIVGNTISLSTVPIASGGTDATTAAGAIQNLLPSYTGNGGKRLGLNSGATALEWVTDGGGTVTSVSGTGSVNGLTLTGTVTSSGSLTLGGTLSNVANSALTNSAITINGTSTSLGGSINVGTVTSVAASGGTTGLTFTGSPITTSGTLTLGGTLAIANGGTGQTTANAAFNALAPSQTGNSGKYLTTDGTDTSWATNPLGTVTSVAATVPSFLSISGSPITTSGTLAFGLSGTALPTTSGGTGLTSFTANGVVYASSTSALATGSALVFDGTKLGVGTSSPDSVITFAGNITSKGNDDYGIGTNGGNNHFNVFATGASGAVRFWTGGSSATSVGGGGTERARIDSAGNFGIGTSSPSAKLQIGTGGATGLVDTVFLGGNSTNTAQFRWVWNHVGAGYLGIGTASDAYGAMIFGQASGATGAVTTEWMRIDGSGNLGLGVTPSAWAVYKAYQVGWGALASYADADTAVFSNAYFDGGAWRYVGNGTASQYRQLSGAHSWQTAASGTAGNAITFTQAMSLNASSELNIDSGTGGGRLTFTPSSANNTISSTTTGFGAYNILRYYATQHQWFNPSNSQTMTLDVFGKLGIGTTSPNSNGGSTAGVIHVNNSATDGWAISHYTNGTTGPNSNDGLIVGNIGADAYIFNYENSNIIFGTNSGEKARINASGNFGIGTTNPGQKLEVSSGDAVTRIAISNTANAANGSGLQFLVSNGATTVSNVTIRADNADNIQFFNIGGERARITSSGELLVGRSSSSGLGQIQSTIGADLATDSGSVYLVRGGGNVGIGTTSLAGLKLVALGATGYPATSGTTQTGVLRLTGGTGLYNVLDMGVNESTDTAWIQATRANSLGTYDKLIINPYGGNVGIGTTNPSQRLTVVGNITATGQIIADGTSAEQYVASSKGGVTTSYLITDANGSNLKVDGAWPIRFTTNGSERARIDSSGNVGIGTSSPTGRLDVLGSSNRFTVNPYYFTAFSGGMSSYAKRLFGGAVVDDYSYIGDMYYENSGTWKTPQTSYAATTFGGGVTTFYGGTGVTANTAFYPVERARITSDGVFYMNRTTTNSYDTNIWVQCDISSWLIVNNHTFSTQYFNVFRYAGTSIGSIIGNGTSTTYATSSDYRLKENIAPMTGALAKVAQLKPCTYTWKSNGSSGEGFIAHELAEVMPQAVTGEKDAVDENGKPDYQGIDTSFLVATLTAAIQELKAEFDAYKASHP